jgi:hypothetical protein
MSGPATVEIAETIPRLPKNRGLQRRRTVYAIIVNAPAVIDYSYLLKKSGLYRTTATCYGSANDEDDSVGRNGTY